MKYLTVKRLMLTIYAKFFYLLWIALLMHKKNECLSLVINNTIDWIRMTFDMCVGFLIWRKSYYLDVDIKYKNNVQFILCSCRLALYQVTNNASWKLVFENILNEYGISSNQNIIESCFYWKKLN